MTHDPLVSEQVNRTIAIRDGRTSTETLRHRSISSAGHHFISEEYAVLDRVGRLQLPPGFVEALGLERRVRLELESDHITVWPFHSRSWDGTPVAGLPADRVPAPVRPVVDVNVNDVNVKDDADDHARYRPKDGPRS